MNPRLVPASTVAEALGVAVGTVYRYVREGTIRAYRVGPRMLRFRLEEVLEDLADATNAAPPCPDVLPHQIAPVAWTGRR